MLLRSLILILIWLSTSSLLAQDTSYYKNSVKIKSIGLIANDLREGTWHFYYLRGTLSAQLVYNEGRLDGEQFYYYPNGSLQALEIWNQGFLQDSAFLLLPNGGVRKKGKYLNNLYSGNWKFYYSNGHLKKKMEIINKELPLVIGNFL